jgi:endosialidase-like protein
MKSGTEPTPRIAGDDADDQSVMALVRRLRGVSFEWREDAPSGHSGSDLGVIAQEVEDVFPELVRTDERGYKLVNYAGLIAPLIEAVKELDARVQALEMTSEKGSARR